MADRFDDATQVRNFYLFLSYIFPLNNKIMLQKELQAFLEREQAQARVQQSIHTFTSMCWDKCVLFNCVFFDILLHHQYLIQLKPTLIS
jgi:Tim10/DDP family zinc finger